MAQLRYWIILAIDASQAAVGEEYGARASSTGYGRLFPEVRVKAGHLHGQSRLAIAHFPLQSINAAAARAELTALKKRVSPDGPLLEGTVPMQ